MKFASPEVAVATVTSKMSTFTTPDGTKHENEEHIRTFILVRRNDRWMIMQDQNTVSKCWVAYLFSLSSYASYH